MQAMPAACIRCRMAPCEPSRGRQALPGRHRSLKFARWPVQAQVRPCKTLRPARSALLPCARLAGARQGGVSGRDDHGALERDLALRGLDAPRARVGASRAACRATPPSRLSLSRRAGPMQAALPGRASPGTAANCPCGCLHSRQHCYQRDWPVHSLR